MNKRSKPDHWTLKALKEGYPARSVYKLQEIQQKHKLIKKGQKVLDVGASPGSWSLYVLRQLKGNGSVTAVDLKPLNMKQRPKGLVEITGDVFSEEIRQELIGKGPYDLIISDAAPNTTGNRLVDTARSLELVNSILDLCEDHLKGGGSFLVKIFQGGDENTVFERMQGLFQTVKRIKPKAVRSESFEMYFAGIGKHEKIETA